MSRTRTLLNVNIIYQDTQTQQTIYQTEYKHINPLSTQRDQKGKE